MQICLSWPLSHTAPKSILPIFIPFSGCPQRCIFCAQEVQSGTEIRSTAMALAQAERQLQDRKARALPPIEVGFFGGTFTALPQEDFSHCLDFVYKAREQGYICGARCSTRPDALHREMVEGTLPQAGFTTIELGIQSFHDAALMQTRRHYNGTIAREACDLVRESGLTLGVQLMPGMPGVDTEIFLQDVDIALSYGAQLLRFYPCLVLQDTALAALWQEGKYVPWDMSTTVQTLAKAWLKARFYTVHMSQGVHVIRMGLAPEEGLAACILAGPQHPCLGAEVQAYALFHYVQQCIKNKIVQSITIPKHCQGFFWGHKQALVAFWAQYGITSRNVHWYDGADIVIVY